MYTHILMCNFKDFLFKPGDTLDTRVNPVNLVYPSSRHLPTSTK